MLVLCPDCTMFFSNIPCSARFDMFNSLPKSYEPVGWTVWTAWQSLITVAIDCPFGLAGPCQMVLLDKSIISQALAIPSVPKILLSCVVIIQRGRSKDTSPILRGTGIETLVLITLPPIPISCIVLPLKGKSVRVVSEHAAPVSIKNLLWWSPNKTFNTGFTFWICYYRAHCCDWDLGPSWRMWSPLTVVSCTFQLL